MSICCLSDLLKFLDKYGDEFKYPNIPGKYTVNVLKFHTPVSDQMAYARSVCHSTKYFKK